MFARLFDNPLHLLILVLVIVVVFGWKRLPDAARSLGRSARILKSEVGEMSNDSKAAGETVKGERTGAPGPVPPQHGATPAGSVPGESTPPRAESPAGDHRPQYERPQYDQHDERQQYERPQYERPQYDQHYERPQYDQQQPPYSPSQDGRGY